MMKRQAVMDHTLTFDKYFVDEKDPDQDQKEGLFWVKSDNKISVNYF